MSTFSTKHAINNALRQLNLHFITDNGAEVAPGLWIGSLATANDNFITAHNIAGVINLSGYQNTISVPIEVHTIDMFDQFVSFELVDLYVGKMTEVAGYISNILNKGNVLVHCAAGINRSAMCIIMYLIMQGESYESAFAKVVAANNQRGAPTLTNHSFRYLLRACDSFKKIAASEIVVK